MFVERLTKEDIIEFINSCSIKKYSITDINHFNFYGFNRWDVRLEKVDKYDSFNKFKYTIVLEDFSIDGACLIDKKLFKAFMYKKFGEEYKQAFNDQLKRKFEEELIK